MSETQNLICLHCGEATNAESQEVFDEVGIELQLDKLLEEHFQILVAKQDDEHQVLCEDCVNRLIELYDLAEYAKEKAAVNQNEFDDATQNGFESPVTKEAENNSKPNANEFVNTDEISEYADEDASGYDDDSREEEFLSLSRIELLENSVKAYSDEAVLQVEESNVVPDAPSDNATDSIDDTCDNYQSESNSNDREQVEDPSSNSVFVFENIDNLDEFYASPANSNSNTNTNTNTNTSESCAKLTDTNSLNDLELVADEVEEYDNVGEDQDEFIPDADIEKVNEFDFVDIDVYLENILKSKLEDIQFNWESHCDLCLAGMHTFQDLLNHIAMLHYEKGIGYLCILPDCKEVLADYRQLARHIVLRHCDLRSLMIYGSCIECDLRFSNFLQFNKHSCCRTLKLRPGTRFFCVKCNLDFPSWKRYVFHMQFHLLKRRPKVCFICELFFNDITEFFEHVHYAHEPDNLLACKKCDRIFKNEETYKLHELNHQNTPKFHCQYCSRQYDHRTLLTRHLETVHMTAELLPCDICDKEFNNKVTLNQHKKTHILSAEAQVYYCVRCGLLETDNDGLREHITDKSSSCFEADLVEDILTNAYVCEYCNLDFKSPADVKAHRDTGLHANGTYSCRVCKQEFKSLLLARNHHKSHKSYEQWIKVYPLTRHFVCEYGDCMETYSNWPALYTHRKRLHNSSSCEICNQHFKQPEDYEKHKRKCQLEAEWTCQFCGKECPTKMSLSVHIARTHNNNNINCPNCNASYKNEEKLQEHIDYMHTPVQCKYCHKTIKNQRNYETHERNVHFKEERYNCQHCNKGFFHKSEKDAHEQNVHPVTTYRCSECAFKTTYPKSLDIHIATTHKMEYQYKCHICSREFGRKHVLDMHIKRHEVNKQLPCPKGCKSLFVSQHLLNKHLKEKHGIRKRTHELLETIATPSAKRTRRTAKKSLHEDDSIKETLQLETPTTESTIVRFDVIEEENTTNNNVNYIELSLLEEEDIDENEQADDNVEMLTDNIETNNELGEEATYDQFEMEEIDSELVEYIDCD